MKTDGITTQAQSEPGVAAYELVYNERGVIAENYHDLQALGVLEAARQAYPLPKGSDESTLRALFQAAEIGLINLADLIARATSDLERGAFHTTATVKMFWARGFHRVLTRLSVVPHQLGVMRFNLPNAGKLSVYDSPGFRQYLGRLQEFDQKVMELIDAETLAAGSVIGDRSLDSAEYNFLHLVRVCNHESTIWESNLAEVHVPAPVPSYEEFVVASTVRDAVYDRVLTGDTYFTQFRGLHQIPETLGEDVNDRMEKAIRALRGDHLREAVDELTCINSLVDAIAAAVPPMADNLATSDYHLIRENLGLTSGSHSVGLRFHMFTHLYEELAQELTNCALRIGPGASPEEAFRNVAEARGEDDRAWLLDLIGVHCLKFRAFIHEWRDEHLHLPRNNLGGEFTKSLTGSPDAVRAVKQMRDSAWTKDPMTPLVRARRLPQERMGGGPLSAYLDSAASLDTRILSITGRVTQNRFVQVQERLGFFANRCPFAPPPRRIA